MGVDGHIGFIKIKKIIEVLGEDYSVIVKRNKLLLNVSKAFNKKEFCERKIAEKRNNYKA